MDARCAPSCAADPACIWSSSQSLCFRGWNRGSCCCAPNLNVRGESKFPKLHPTHSLLRIYGDRWGSGDRKSEAGWRRLWQRRSLGKVQKQIFPSHLEIPLEIPRRPRAPQPRLLLGTLGSWTRWLRPKLAKLAPFNTTADVAGETSGREPSGRRSRTRNLCISWCHRPACHCQVTSLPV